MAQKNKLKPASKKTIPAKGAKATHPGRTPPKGKPAPIEQRPAGELTVIRQDTKALDAERKRLAEIDSRFGDGVPYSKERVINETRFYLTQSAEALLEAGKRIILLKEHEPAGDFHKSLEAIGLPPRAAQKMMQASVKFSGDRKALATLGKTKMLELVAEEDDDLAALQKGGTLAGLNLDDIERMSAHELRLALRKERHKREQEAETHTQMLKSKDEKLNKLDRELRNRATAEPWPHEVAGLKEDLLNLSTVIDEALGKHMTAIDATDVAIGTAAPDSPAFLGYKSVVHHLGDQIERICTLAANLRFAYDTRLGGYILDDKGHILPEPDAAE